MGYNSKQVPAHLLHLLPIPLRNFFIQLMIWCEVVVSRYRKPDCIVLAESFVRLHKVQTPLLEVVKHADLHWIEEVGLREVAHNTGNMSNNVESWINMPRREFGIGWLGVGIAERSI